MTLSGIIGMRFVLGDQKLGDLPKLRCDRCREWTPERSLKDVSEFTSQFGQCCAGCLFDVQGAAHVGDDACVCSVCCGQRRKADVWGLRAVR